MEVEFAAAAAAAAAAAVLIYSPFLTITSIFDPKNTDKGNTLVNCWRNRRTHSYRQLQVLG